MELYTTANSIVTEMEAAYRNVTGKAGFSAGDIDIVNSSIMDAMQIVMLEYGLEDFKFYRKDISVDTVADTAYIDIEQFAFRVCPGTVRIPDKDKMLSLVDEESVFAVDPDLSQTGEPESYMYMAPSDIDTIRLRLWPTPDAVYTLKMSVMVPPTFAIENGRANSFDAFPAIVQSAIKYKAKALAAIQLGTLAALAGSMDAAYNEIITKIKGGYRHNGPLSISMCQYNRPHRGIQSRLPS